MEITFWGPFFDKEDGLQIGFDKQVVRYNIPPQVVKGAITDAIESVGGAVNSGAKGVLGSNMIINLFLSGSLN